MVIREKHIEDTMWFIIIYKMAKMLKAWQRKCGKDVEHQIWAPPKADAETNFQVQVIYLGCDPKVEKYGREIGNEMQKINYALSSKLAAGVTEA